MIRLQLKKLVVLTRLEQTLFGLPILFSASLLVDPKLSFVKLLFLIGAFISARISGMAFNQWLDLEFDRENPRTQDRPLVKKLVSSKEAKIVALSSLAVFLLFSLYFNLETFFLGLVAAFLIAGYSLTKRFTPLSHFVLGAIHALHPLMLSLALTRTIMLPLFFLAGFAFCFISGNDILYAFQDRVFDQKRGLCSIPAFLGEKKSMQVTIFLHFLALFHVVMLGCFLGQLPLFVGFAALMLIRLIPLYLTQNERAFFLSTASLPFFLMSAIILGRYLT